MSAHLTPPEQSRLIARTLAPDQWQGCLAHLGACATCRATVQRLRNQTMSLNPAIEPATTWATEWTPAHLEYEQLAGYVTRRLEGVEREIADNHLAVCEFCSVELQELAALHHDLRTLPVNAAVAPASQSQPFIQPQPLIAWLANFKERFAWPGGLALAGALCLLLLSFGI